MISGFVLQPVTETSHPLAWAAKKCDFANRGYVEEEFFYHGTSNVYTEASGSLETVVRDARYTNRLLVRRPARPEKASGRVVIEILNATTHMDIDRIWQQAKEEFMRNGDVYIGFSSKPVVLNTLKKFDPKRYAELEWPNPRPELELAPEISKSINGSLFKESEYGLLWDMITDLPVCVRSGLLSLGGIKATHVYLAGWSQSSCITFRYGLTFAKSTRAYDGYLAAGGANTKGMLTPLNQYEVSDQTAPLELIDLHSDVPFVAVQTESENALYAFLNDGVDTCFGELSQKLDSDAPGDLYRTYDIPGSTHDNEYNMTEYYRNDMDVQIVGVVHTYIGREPYPNDYPYEIAFCAIFHHLFAWAEQGVTPPRVSRIQTDMNLRNVRDAGGNAVGGWRLPFVDIPYASYLQDVTPMMGPSGMFTKLYGCKIPFSKEKLVQWYGTLQRYKELVEKRTDELVCQGMILPIDRNAAVEICVKRAKQGGLE